MLNIAQPWFHFLENQSLVFSLKLLRIVVYFIDILHESYSLIHRGPLMSDLSVRTENQGLSYCEKSLRRKYMLFFVKKKPFAIL